MVTLEIPHGCTLSPSLATPQLTINHEIADELDSSNAFEGPEKLLEVWFAPSPATVSPTVHAEGLKAVPQEEWEEMLDLVNCKVLSVLRSDTVDAYLLSESSMFVFPHKIILKTCGTTTLLLGLHRLLRIAATSVGFPFHNAASLDDVRAAATPYRVFYSRKNFLFPEKQQGPHRSWKQEVKYLDDMFEGGSAYMVGKMNGDHWYLYITSLNTGFTPPQTPDSGKRAKSPTQSFKIPTGILSYPALPNTPDSEINDETLEILMTDLDPENAKQFYLAQASAVARDKFASSSSSSSAFSGKPPTAHSTTGSVSVGGLSDSVLSFSAADEIFDVDDMSHPSAGALTPTSEHTTDWVATEGHDLGGVVTESCGLADVYPATLYPDSRIDAYMFSPCGFSANGVIPAPIVSDGNTDNGASRDRAMHYFTVHVTPEPHCSYASFETNVPGGQEGRQTADIVKHVVDIFRPGRFSVTLFEAKGTVKDQYFLADESGRQSAASSANRVRLERIPGYRRIDRIVHDFEDYDLVFRYYEREDWVGDGEARVGEL